MPVCDVTLHRSQHRRLSSVMPVAADIMYFQQQQQQQQLQQRVEDPLQTTLAYLIFIKHQLDLTFY